MMVGTSARSPDKAWCCLLRYSIPTKFRNKLRYVPRSLNGRDGQLGYADSGIHSLIGLVFRITRVAFQWMVSTCSFLDSRNVFLSPHDRNCAALTRV